MPGCIALLAACLLLAGCSSKSPSSNEGTFSGAVYTVKRGDTLSKISRMTGSSVGDLARLNGIPSPYTIQVGQRIRIKGSGSASRPKNTVTAKKTTATSRTQNSSIAKVAPPPAGARCWLWPTKGNIVMPFSNSDGGNKGIDISGSRGQPIYASGAGTVVYVGNQLRGYGNLVMIKHSEEYITAYAHNDTMLVNTGEKVKAGQKIATMGNTGADSVRLHFQIRYRATAIDPQRYLKPSC